MLTYLGCAGTRFVLNMPAIMSRFALFDQKHKHNAHQHACTRTHQHAHTYLWVGRHTVRAEHASNHEQVRSVGPCTRSDEEEDDGEEEEQVLDVLDRAACD